MPYWLLLAFTDTNNVGEYTGYNTNDGVFSGTLTWWKVKH